MGVVVGVDIDKPWRDGEAIGIGESPTVATAYLMIAVAFFLCARLAESPAGDTAGDSGLIEAESTG